MILTDLGKTTTTLSASKKLDLATELRRGRKDVTLFMKGVCYDAVAFLLYLQGDGITTMELEAISGKDWVSKFKFSSQWDGSSNIPEGKAIGFYRVIDDKTFHAAVAIGGTEIRAINGLHLGVSWLVPVNLKDVLTVKNPDGTFNYDGIKIRVYLSSI